MSTADPTLPLPHGLIPWSSCLYHESIGVVFVAIPKVGCTTVKRWFLSHVLPDVLEHPEADRLRSAFVDKFVRAGPDNLFAPARDLLVTFYAEGVPDLARGLTFREFVNYVCHTREDLLDEHWRPQASFLRHKPVEALLPLENMAIALRSVSMLLGKPSASIEPTSVTRKEPAGRGLLADAPSGDLHRANLRPPLRELADAGLLDRIHVSLSEDRSLYQRASGHANIGSLLAGIKFGPASS